MEIYFTDFETSIFKHFQKCSFLMRYQDCIFELLLFDLSVAV